MADKSIILSPDDSYYVWNYNNLKVPNLNYYEGSFNNKNFSLSHKSYIINNNYHISIQNSSTKEYDIVDFRKFNMPYFNFVYLLNGNVLTTFYNESKIFHEKDDWVLNNSKFNESGKSNIIYKSNNNIRFIHITLLESLLNYYKDFDTPLSSMIEDELARNSKKILCVKGRYNPIIKMIVNTILNNLNKGILGEKIIQIKIDELFLSVIPELIKNGNRVFDNINDYIYGNFNKKITLSHLSKIFKVSEYYIKESIKSDFDTTFTNYIKLIRLQKAHELYYSNKNLSYKEIAKNVGYTNSSRLKNDLENYLEELKKRDN